MLVKAVENFSGAVSMTIGQTKELAEGEILSDLLKAGYVEEVAPVQTKKTMQEDKVETKRSKQRVSK